jgi:hypothetical protein
LRKDEVPHKPHVSSVPFGNVKVMHHE